MKKIGGIEMLTEEQIEMRKKFIPIDSLKKMIEQLELWVLKEEKFIADKHWQMISDFAKSQITTKSTNEN